MSNENDHIRFPSMTEPTQSSARGTEMQEQFATDLQKMRPRKRKTRKRKPGRRTAAAESGAVVGACMGPKPTDRNLVKMVIQKPFCTPCRSIMTNTPKCPIYQSGVRYWDYVEHKPKRLALKEAARRMKIELKHFENLRHGPLSAPVFLPMACEASFYVTKEQQEWATYCVERTGRLYVVSGGKNVRKNRKWADTHDGTMPKPWYEPSCSEAKSLYGQIGNIVKKNRKKKGRK